MSNQYNNYLEQHIGNVIKGFEWLQTNLPDLVKDVDADDIRHHDQSKYGLVEYSAYDAYFYGNNKSYAVVQNFNEAWLHHIHHNPHHWQHWILINDDPKEGEIILEMDHNFIIEMICDWWAFSWAKGNLHEIFGWYDEHKDYMKLNPRTRATVESILEKIKEKLGELEAENV